VFSAEAILALRRLGLEEGQVQDLAKGKPIAFNLAGAAEGTICVACLPTDDRLQIGIYTIKNVGGGLPDFMTFDARSRSAAIALGVKEVETMGIEVTHLEMRAVLERGGFTPTTFDVPDELGGGTFDALSRVDRIE
jgi:hypothetical protein